jgi:glycosyltransferase involved in cell wall biosynthesis/GT2 family glycosyltransferase
VGQGITVPPSEIDIVVPAYNAERYLDSTLRAVSEQTCRSWRCVVVDDGSSDSTAEIARRFAANDERFALVSQTNQGVASARNNGARLSTSEFVMFLDADDMLIADALERLRDVLLSNPDAPAVHGRATVVDELGQRSDSEGYEQRFGRLKVGDSLLGRLEAVPDTESTGLDTLALRNPITTPGQALIRRRAFEDAGGFDPTVQPAEDWDHWIRLARLGSFAYLPCDVILYRKHDAGASAQLSKMRSAELRVRHRLIARANAVRQHPNDTWPEGTETFARLGLRRTEIQRAQERLALAVHSAADGQLRTAMQDLARATSSLVEVGRSFLPARQTESTSSVADGRRSVMLVSTASNIGGMERVICGLALHIPTSGFTVRTFVPQSDRSELLLAWCRDQGVTAQSDPAVLDAAAPHSPRAAYALWRLIRRIDPKVVNLHYGDNFLSLWDVLAAKASGRHRCVVVSIHHPTPWTNANRRKRAMTALGGRLADGITTFSHATEKILRETPLPAKRIHRIPCGIAVPDHVITRSEGRRLFDLPKDGVIIGCIARLVEHKRIDLLIEAADTPELAGSVLIIGGDGPLRDKLEARAAAAQHIGVRLVGRIDDINDLLAACDIFALPSELEGFGLVYLEAAVHGVPSVATRVGGIPDAVIDEETGILVEVGDVDELRNALVRLARDESLRRRLGGAASRRVRGQLNDVTMSSRFANIFGQLS